MRLLKTWKLRMLRASVARLESYIGYLERSIQSYRLLAEAKRVELSILER